MFGIKETSIILQGGKRQIEAARLFSGAELQNPWPGSKRGVIFD